MYVHLGPSPSFAGPFVQKSAITHDWRYHYDLIYFLYFIVAGNMAKCIITCIAGEMLLFI